MFLVEQQANYNELQRAFQLTPCQPDHHCAEFIERSVWSPISCRHTMWLYLPLCRCDERGNIIRGSRQRNPFPPYVRTQDENQ